MRQRVRQVAENPRPRSWDARARHYLFGERLARFDARGGGGRTEDAQARIRETVRDAGG